MGGEQGVRTPPPPCAGKSQVVICSPPMLELSGSAHACLRVDFVLLSYFLELIDRSARMRRLICAMQQRRVSCNKVHTEWGK